MTTRWIQLALLTLLLTAPVPQSTAHDLPAALERCRAESDGARRLACYDLEVGKPGEPSTAAADSQSPEERFGYRGELARTEQDRAKDDARSLGQLDATVTAVSVRGDGTMVATLDNGQVWAQNRPDAFFRLKDGEQIRIKPAALGSFMMINSSKRSARVTRVK